MKWQALGMCGSSALGRPESTQAGVLGGGLLTNTEPECGQQKVFCLKETLG